MEPKNCMWTEKYRPENIDEMVGDFREDIKKYLDNPEEMQHLLLHSITPGTGKTTLAKVIINELGSDKLILNSSDKRGIDTIREDVSQFVKTKSSKEGLRRIVFLDEADRLTKTAQDSLRNLMETYASNAIFILTCNSISKIKDAIQSRCRTIKFKNPDKDEILNYLKMICENEELEYTEDGLNKIIDMNYPSIRNCVQVIQGLYTSDKDITVDNAKTSDEEFQKLWDKIYKEKNWKDVKKYIFKNNVRIRELNKFFWTKAVLNNHVKIMQITASNENKFARGGENLVIFVTSLIDMAK